MSLLLAEKIKTSPIFSARPIEICFGRGAMTEIQYASYYMTRIDTAGSRSWTVREFRLRRGYESGQVESANGPAMELAAMTKTTQNNDRFSW